MQDNAPLKRIALKTGEVVVLLGTAHVSSASVEDVGTAFDEFRPDTVCVEIDQGRLDNLKDSDAWRKLDLVKVLKKKQGFLLLVNLSLAAYQKRIGAQSGVTPGAEMKVAVELAEARGVNIALCDRSIAVTLRRAWRISGFLGRFKLLLSLVAGAFDSSEPSMAEIERLKSGDTLGEMMAQLAKELPKIKEVLIDERDAYLAAKIYKSTGSTRLAVLGAGHLPGVEQALIRLDEGEDLGEEAFNVVPKPSIFARVFPWLVTAIILAVIVCGFVFSGRQVGAEMVWTWALSAGVPAAVGAIAALANPITVVAALVAAPFTTLTPVLGVGIVAGVVQAMVKKPRVLDFENLGEDKQTLKGWYRNRVTKVLLTMLLTSVFTVIGHTLGIVKIVSLLRRGA